MRSPTWTSTSGAGPKAAQTAASSESASPVPAGQNLLFTTPTCPNCRLAVTMLDKQNFPYEKLNAQENAELAVKYGVKQAPTLGCHH